MTGGWPPTRAGSPVGNWGSTLRCRWDWPTPERNCGGGSLSWTKSNSGLPSTGQYVGVAMADFNNDGNDDIVSTSYFNPDPEVHLFTGNGNGGWTSWDSLMPKPGNYGQAYGVTVGDFDEDGNMDLVYGRKSYGVVCLLGNGGGANGTDFKWTSGNTGLPSTNHYYGAFVGDLDSDGNLDILLANGFNNVSTPLMRK